MGKAEDFIKDHIRNDSNTNRGWHNRGVSIPTIYLPWVVPNVARKAAEIAREETIKEVCEWLYNHNDYICGGTNGIIRYDMDKLIKDLKKHLEDKL